MTERSRDLALVIVVIVALLLAWVFDSLTEPVAAPDLAVSEQGKVFRDRAVFCPPPSREEGARAQVMVGAPEGATAYAFEPELEGEVQELKEGRAQLLESEGASRVAGLGRPVIASATTSLTEPLSATGGARCATQASNDWYFPEGSAAVGFDQRLLLYNPFPDEAVAKITFFSKRGETAKANLADVEVPSGEWTIVKINDFITTQNYVASAVRTIRGRIVAWRALTAEPKERPGGMEFTLGADGTSDVWYLPDGAVGDGLDERIALMNPTSDEAIVNISLTTSDGTVQPPKLVDIVVPPMSAKSISLLDNLRGEQRDLGGVSATVQSTTGAELAVERTVWYDTSDTSGVASEVGATIMNESWFLGSAVTAKRLSDAVVLFNPGTKDARVSVSLLGDEGDPLTPNELADYRLKAGVRERIQIGRWTDGRSMIAMVEADVPIVAERSAATGSDVAALMGRPFRLSGR